MPEIRKEITIIIAVDAQNPQLCDEGGCNYLRKTFGRHEQKICNLYAEYLELTNSKPERAKRCDKCIKIFGMSP